MTGGPEDALQNNAPLDNRIAAWSLTGTRSLNGSSPSLQLSHEVLTSETYGLPINFGATQKPGPTPLRAALGDVDPLETINANDSRMNHVLDLHGILFGGVNTTVTSATGPDRVGIAYFVVGAVGNPFGVFAHILNQGYVARSSARPATARSRVPRALTWPPPRPPSPPAGRSPTGSTSSAAPRSTMGDLAAETTSQTGA